jgi:hypothetical protein
MRSSACVTSTPVHRRGVTAPGSNGAGSEQDVSIVATGGVAPSSHSASVDRESIQAETQFANFECTKGVTAAGSNGAGSDVSIVATGGVAPSS